MIRAIRIIPSRDYAPVTPLLGFGELRYKALNRVEMFRT